MQDDVRAQIQGVLQVGGAEGVVHQDRDASFVGESRHRRDVRQDERGVGRGLQVDQAGPVGDGGREVGRIIGWHFGYRDAQAGQGLGKELVGSAVQGVSGHDMVPGPAAGEHRGRGRGHAAGQGQGGFPVFQIRHFRLQGRGGRVAQSRVHVAGILAAEDGRPVFGALEGEGGALEDGRAHRPDGPFPLVLVQVLLAVDAQGGEAGRMFLLGHHFSPLRRPAGRVLAAFPAPAPPRGRCRFRSSVLSSRSQEKS